MTSLKTMMFQYTLWPKEKAAFATSSEGWEHGLSDAFMHGAPVVFATDLLDGLSKKLDSRGEAAICVSDIQTYLTAVLPKCLELSDYLAHLDTFTTRSCIQLGLLYLDFFDTTQVAVQLYMYKSPKYGAYWYLAARNAQW